VTVHAFTLKTWLR